MAVHRHRKRASPEKGEALETTNSEHRSYSPIERATARFLWQVVPVLIREDKVPW